MDNIPISFVTCAYNDVLGMARHFDYFTSSGASVELIIIDDCSTDGLQTLVGHADLPGHFRLRYHRNPQNIGPGPSRNIGLAIVSNPLMMFLDADDLLADAFFAYIALSPMANGADFVLFKYHLSVNVAQRHSYTMHHIDNQFFSNIGLCSFPNRTFTLDEIPSVLRTINFPWNKVYRSDFIRSAGIQFPDYRMHEDILPHWHSFLAARRFAILHWAPPLIHHFEAPGTKRATNYVGEHRLAAFETLLDVQNRCRVHPLADLLAPELIAFSEVLIERMIRTAPRGGGPEGWRQRYRQAADVCIEKLRRDPAPRPATEMGQMLS